MVRTAADMTVRQIISLLFDRVADELGVVPAEDAASTDVRGKDWAGAAEGVPKEGSSEKGEREAGSEEGALRCAHLVFQVKGGKDRVLANTGRADNIRCEAIAPIGLHRTSAYRGGGDRPQIVYCRS